ncbi:MAG: hypothetical protein ACREEY_11740 [Brevundimonas sp.]
MKYVKDARFVVGLLVGTILTGTIWGVSTLHDERRADQQAQSEAFFEIAPAKYEAKTY